MGLNDSYNQICVQLLLLDPIPPINKVFSLVSQEEHQRKLTTQSNSGTPCSIPMAFVARNDNSRNINSTNLGHTKGQG